MDRSLLEKKALAELRQIASTLELKGYQRMKKADLVDLIIGAGGPDGSNGDASSGNGEGTRARDAGDGDGGDGSRQRARGRQRDDDGQDTDQGRDADGDGDDDGDDDDDDRGGRNRNKQRRRKNRGNQQQDLDEAEVREGVLDLLPEGYGFLRTTGYLSGSKDVYVSQSFVRRFHLRRGDRVRGPIRSNNRGNDKFPALARVDTIDGLTVDEHAEQRRRDFRDLTPTFPDERLRLETDGGPLALRLLDVVAPVGKGQRGLVLAPPRAGTTTLLRQLALAIEANDPATEVMVVLVDERPEEVTDFQRATDAEVIASAFDRPAEDHTQIAELALERAKRLAERGRDVVILLDSLTRLARAHDLASTGGGRTLPGGIDGGALHPVKRLFAAARNLEEGGSLTIIAAAAADTGSVTDEVVLDALRDTANLEVRLTRPAGDTAMFPAVDVQRSGTRRAELLQDDTEQQAIRALHGAVADMDGSDALRLVAERLDDAKDNATFVETVANSGLD